MNQRDRARYALCVLLTRTVIVVLGGVMIFVLMWQRVISQDAGVPILAVLVGGAGLSALGSSSMPTATDTHRIEP